jgi:hypothetical protein
LAPLIVLTLLGVDATQPGISVEIVHAENMCRAPATLRHARKQHFAEGWQNARSTNLAQEVFG